MYANVRITPTRESVGSCLIHSPLLPFPSKYTTYQLWDMRSGSCAHQLQALHGDQVNSQNARIPTETVDTCGQSVSEGDRWS